MPPELLNVNCEVRQKLPSAADEPSAEADACTSPASGSRLPGAAAPPGLLAPLGLPAPPGLPDALGLAGAPAPDDVLADAPADAPVGAPPSAPPPVQAVSERAAATAATRKADVF
ncbi:hypothetical protein ACFYY2_29530 [Streptomyces sp. NPDC001822]|uniref:hypothetical protein n=1 Tax=Streptomyces sp. NPDC001822 TaxID=3364614 RepID=UPI0036CBA98C